jgi:nucleoside-diphosphate kinase
MSLTFTSLFVKALKLVSPSKEMLEEHYGDLKEKKFFPAMLAYMLSGN